MLWFQASPELNVLQILGTTVSCKVRCKKFLKIASEKIWNFDILIYQITYIWVHIFIVPLWCEYLYKYGLTDLFNTDITCMTNNGVVLRRKKCGLGNGRLSHCTDRSEVRASWHPKCSREISGFVWFHHILEVNLKVRNVPWTSKLLCSKPSRFKFVLLLCSRKLLTSMVWNTKHLNPDTRQAVKNDFLIFLVLL